MSHFQWRDVIIDPISFPKGGSTFVGCFRGDIIAIQCIFYLMTLEQRMNLINSATISSRTKYAWRRMAS